MIYAEISITRPKPLEPSSSNPALRQFSVFNERTTLLPVALESLSDSTLTDARRVHCLSIHQKRFRYNCQN